MVMLGIRCPTNLYLKIYLSLKSIILKNIENNKMAQHSRFSNIGAVLNQCTEKWCSY